jgi:hypothetical protein
LRISASGPCHFRPCGGIIQPTLYYRLLLAVVRSQIRSSPSADCATASALDVAQNFVSLEAVNRQLPRMMTGPVAFALAETIDKQLANAVSAN